MFSIDENANTMRQLLVCAAVAESSLQPVQPVLRKCRKASPRVPCIWPVHILSSLLGMYRSANTCLPQYFYVRRC